VAIMIPRWRLLLIADVGFVVGSYLLSFIR
jgi:hypothetical protein